MKTYSTSLIVVLMMLFYASNAHAQNKSAENSNVITIHRTFEWNNWIYCPETGLIGFATRVHEIRKVLPNGTYTVHYNVYGEGEDEYGDLWKWHHTWIQKYDVLAWLHEMSTLILQGPKGAKLDLRVLFVRNGNGDIVKSEFDPLCN